MDDLMNRDALELSAMLEARKISAVELMQATLDQIERVNPGVNAVVSLRDADTLLAEARAADDAPRKGWLHGVPLAVKDLRTGFETSDTAGVLDGDLDGLMAATLAMDVSGKSRAEAQAEG